MINQLMMKKMKMKMKETDEIMQTYNISEIAFRIGEAATTGMLYEVSTSPSPGLVSPISNGIHKDMDFYTFLRSTSSISYAMTLCAQVGIDHENDILARIRRAGIKAERHMLNKTNGVNTQRGILFAAGVVSAAAGRCVAEWCNKEAINNESNRSEYSTCGNYLNRYEIAKHCSKITEGIVENELKNATVKAKTKMTNGERVYQKYGISGIRGELEGGLRSVIEVGLPFYEAALEHGHTIKDSLAHALIGLMSVVEDTVVINRAGMQGFDFMRMSAKEAIVAGGMLTQQGRQGICLMEDEFIKREISPGGAADMLAISVMIYELEKIINVNSDSDGYSDIDINSCSDNDVDVDSDIASDNEDYEIEQ